jgi:hypothetical protein
MSLTVSTPSAAPKASESDLPSDLSNRGPSIYQNTINSLGYPYLKPQVSAPGENIPSSIASADDAYETKGAHPWRLLTWPGLVALLLQAAPCLTYAKAEKILMETAAPVAYLSGCDEEGPAGVLNNATGWGVVDALQTVRTASGLCGAMGVLHGVVTAVGKPLGGATVTTEGRLTAITDEQGRYKLPHLNAGFRTVRVSRLGYYPEAAAVEVTGESSSKDFELQAKREVFVKGKVTDDGSGAGWPLYATIAVFTPGFETIVHTNPLTGAYSVPLFKDTAFTLTVGQWRPFISSRISAGISYAYTMNDCNACSLTVAKGPSETGVDWSIGFSYSYYFNLRESLASVLRRF